MILESILTNGMYTLVDNHFGDIILLIAPRNCAGRIGWHIYIKTYGTCYTQLSVRETPLILCRSIIAISSR